MNFFFQKGMTLIELTVVLLVLIALAGLALPYVSGTSRKALCDATDVSMVNIKRVIMDRYYLDTLGKFPQDLAGLSSNSGSEKYNLHFLFSKTSLGGRVHKSFDPDTATGWRNGGYLQNGFVLENDLTGNFSLAAYTDPLKQNHIVVMDSWGRPIILQVLDAANCDEWDLPTDQGQCARLVSAGSGSGLGISNGDIDTHIIDDPLTLTITEGHRDADADDRILYLNTPTPTQDVNPGCDS